MNQPIDIEQIKSTHAVNQMLKEVQAQRARALENLERLKKRERIVHFVEAQWPNLMHYVTIVGPSKEDVAEVVLRLPGARPILAQVRTVNPPNADGADVLWFTTFHVEDGGDHWVFADAVLEALQPTPAHRPMCVPEEMP